MSKDTADKALGDLTVGELEAMINDLDARRNMIREQMKAVQRELSKRTSSEKVRALLANMSKDDMAALAQVIAGAGGIKAEGTVGNPRT